MDSTPGGDRKVERPTQVIDAFLTDAAYPAPRATPSLARAENNPSASPARAGDTPTVTERQRSEFCLSFLLRRRSVVCCFCFDFSLVPRPCLNVLNSSRPSTYAGTTTSRTPTTARRPRAPCHGPTTGSFKSEQAIKGVPAMPVPSVPNNKDGGRSIKIPSIGNVMVRASSGL